MPERVIFDYEIIYVKSGKIKFGIDNNEYIVSAGDLILIEPKKTHSISIIGNEVFRQPHIHFDFFEDSDSQRIKVSHKSLSMVTDNEMKLFRRHTFNELFNMNIENVITLKQPHIIEDLMYKVISKKQSMDTCSALSTKGLFIQLMAEIAHELLMINNFQLNNASDALYKAKRYIDNNVDKDITLDQLAQHVHVSKYHLLRMFKQFYLSSPIRYHKMIRMQKAKDMILYTPYTIDCIATLLGYQSVSVFSRVFKNIDGHTPSYYRSNTVQENKQMKKVPNEQ
jgi:AraC-like DNA-binding protein